MTNATKGWVAGIFFLAGIEMAKREWLGLERYIETVKDQWIDLHWTVGAGLALAAIIYYGYLVFKE